MEPRQARVDPADPSPTLAHVLPIIHGRNMCQGGAVKARTIYLVGRRRLGAKPMGEGLFEGFWQRDTQQAKQQVPMLSAYPSEYFHWLKVEAMVLS